MKKQSDIVLNLSQFYGIEMYNLETSIGDFSMHTSQHPKQSLLGITTSILKIKSVIVNNY